jgi:hypothetical protein
MGRRVAQDRFESGLSQNDPQMTSPTIERVGLMGRHKRIDPLFAQKKLQRSDGEGA